MNSATAIIGSENSSRKATIMVIQMKTGIRSRRMPRARRLKMVVMKLTAEISEASPSICSPSAQ